MGRGRGGGGGGSGGKGGGGGGGYYGLYRYRFFRGLLGGGHSPVTNEMLKRVAIARGLRDADALLLVLGKQDTGVSIDEAINLLRNELGTDAVIDAVESERFSRGMSGKPCQTELRKYKELVEIVNKSFDDKLSLEICEENLTKYCGYNPNGEN